MGGRRWGRAVAVVVAVGLAAALFVTVPPSRPAEAGPVADDLADRLLTVRPPVGDTFVVDVPADTGGRLLARSLQGIVNRSEARIYLRDPGDAGAQHWLDRYQAEGLITVVGTGSLADALDRYAGEASGYVVVDLAEPWTVQAGIAIAAVAGAVLATPDQVPALTSRGLTEIDDLRGRWPDAATAYESVAATHRPLLASDAVAVLRPTDAGIDLAVQQQVFTVFTRPSDPSWPRVRALLAEAPPGSPVYGYLSDTGEEEAIALAALATEDLVLVPSDTTRNLSFHLAVGAGRDRVPAPAPLVDDVAPCTADELNVVVGVTDGDNLNVPLNHFTTATNWDSPRRGDLPVAWSMSPALAVLAPAAWDAYAEQASPADELVAMAGWGYGAPALAPDAEGFYRDSFALMDELGLRTFWSLGGGLDVAGAPAWDLLDAVAGDGVPDSVLVGYGNAVGSQLWSPAGRPAYTSRSVYSETPADLEAHVRDLLATPADARPLVSFLAATNWTNPVHDLIGRLAPLEAEGVRFLTPAEAAACLPPPPDPEPPAPVDGRACTPTGDVVPSGLELISAPIVAEVTGRATAFDLATAVVAPPAVAPGGTLTYSATVAVDVPDFAAEVLVERVRPVVAAGYGPELADAAWVELTVDGLALALPAPPGTTPVGTPTASSSGTPATAAWVDDRLVVAVDAVAADTRAPGEPFEVAVTWSVLAPAGPSPATIALTAGALAFDLDLTVGVQLGQLSLTGSVAAAFSCPAPGQVLAATAVPGVTAPVPGPPPAARAPTGAPAAEAAAPTAAAVAAPVTSTPRFTG